MNRRQALALLGAAALSRGTRLLAGPSTSPRFLLVFLRGGYDACNALVPYTSELYYASRPTLAIARPADAAPDGAQRLDETWALAPALRPTLGARFLRGEVAFVPFAGSDDTSRSHFETQDYIERGEPSGARDFRTGFLARLAGVLHGASPIAFTDALPAAFQGANVPNLALRGALKPVFDERQAAILASMYKGSPLEGAVSEGLELRQRVARELAEEQRVADRNAVSPKGFELEARRIGHLMRESYHLGFVDVGGWDTHVNEGAAQGALANNLSSIGRGLGVLADELGGRWRDTVVVVISEFGRTFRENGNRGTDHGHGSAYWVLGGGVKGGRVAGPQVKLERATLFEDRDLPVLTDVRGLLGGVFARLFGLSREQLDKVFPGATPVELGLV